MDITLTHGTYLNCSLQFHKYQNNQPALVIYHEDDVLLKASVNMPELSLPPGYIFIKNWSENEGILEALIENQVIEPPKCYIPSGFVNVYVCKLIEGADNVN